MADLSENITRFGTAPDGGDILLVTIAHAGATALIMTWGASLQDFRLDDVPHSLVLGGPVFAPYLERMCYFGAIAGPVANRIAGGRAPILGQAVALERNENGRTTLHGGTNGSGNSNWTLIHHDAGSCEMHLHVADGTGGLPGPLHLSVRYSLDDDGALVMLIEGHAEVPTLCNPAHHSYWNLDGQHDLSGHVLTVRANHYLPVDDDLIPLGEPSPVAETRFDFLAPRPVTRSGEEMLDHNFCLSDQREELRPVCWLEAGRLCLEIATTEPGLQVYEGAGTDTAPAPGHQGRPYGARAGVALEPQCWPDAPNHPDFPSIQLMPGETYSQLSRFHIRRDPR